MTAGAKVKVRLRFGTLGSKAGSVVSLDKDAADRLVANGHATVEPVKSEKDS